MAFNVTNAVEVPLSTFGSLVTEMSPSDLPEGVSPDNQDVVYVPGNVGTRGAMNKVFSTAFPGNPTVSYGKSYVMPTGEMKNLYLDSTGALWLEDVTNSPGTYSLLLQTTPGMYARSVTAFGREYIAISDGLHGQEVPLQYDGTYLDRVTQDGPGSAPLVQCYGLPSVAMAVTAPPPVLTVTEVDPANLSSGTYTAVNIFISGSASVAQPGMQVTVAGSSNSSLNITYSIAAVYSGPNSLIVCYASLPSGTALGLGGTATIGSGYTILRRNNIVTCTTTAPHFLNVGNQAQITGMTADNSLGGGISSVVINNEDNPGIATVTTASAHGLLPQNFVTLTGIAGTNVGGTIAAISVAGDVLSITMTAAHGLAPGSLITIAGSGVSAANTTFNVASVSSQYAFQCVIVAADATASAGGTVTINWPIPDAATPNYYQVVSAPTATTFQVSVSYADGSWSGGTVSFAWDGYYFVTAVLSTTQFQYQQYGPDATTETVGTVTPYGQIAPGMHQMQVMFLTRQDAITEPSPPVKFIAAGGQYLQVSNIPVGPPNVVARILAFTGAEGGTFFYIPVPAQNSGIVVSTSTQLNDNTNGMVNGLDFSDNTLYASVGISVPGNNVASQIVLDSCLGFGFFDSRLLAFGMRNRLQNLLNLSFDGGYLPALPTQPAGWTIVNVGGALAPGHFGQGWQITCSTAGAHSGGLTQGFYEDAYGVPIATANTPYLLRCWLQPSAATSALNFNVTIYSLATSFQSSATVNGANMSTAGGWFQVPFALPMPVTIPSDLQFSLYAQSSTAGVTLLVDELSVIYADTPYLDQVIYGSYVDNPEAFDGVTGKFGPSLDTHKLMDFGVLRDTLYLLSQDPGGRVHSVANNGVTEPAGWQVSEFGANCGTLSAFSLTKSQADDNSASGGEEWMAWASSSGARMFGGQEPWKISQEIQPDWDSINPAAAKTIWALNDPVARVIYFGLPTGTNTTPNLIYPMNYRELDTAYEIAKSPPVHTSFSGKLIATDNTRKWTRWNLAMNGGALMYRGPGVLEPVFFAGAPYGNVYVINPSKMTDDDYGQIFSYYTTYFFVNHEMEMALQLGGHLKMVAYFTAYVYGTGVITITPLVNNLQNPWALTVSRNLSPTEPNYDLEWGGGNARGQRIAFKFASSPTIGPFGVDNAFTLSKMIVSFRQNARLPVRGAA